MNETPETIDPHNVLTSGEALATAPDLARMLGISRRDAEHFLNLGPYRQTPGTPPIVRFAKKPGGPWLFCIADARAAIEGVRPAIEERRRLAQQAQAADVARGEANRKARQEAHAALMSRKAAKGSAPKPAAQPKPAPVMARPASAKGPEVIVMRRSVRP